MKLREFPLTTLCAVQERVYFAGLYRFVIFFHKLSLYIFELPYPELLVGMLLLLVQKLSPARVTREIS